MLKGKMEESVVLGFKAVLGLVLTGGNILLRAYTLTLLWAWFIVGFGLPPIGLLLALGLDTLRGFLMFNGNRAYEELKAAREKRLESEDDDHGDWTNGMLSLAMAL